MLFVLIIELLLINYGFAESRLYGPGLRASFQVPVRYFYLQSYDSKGNKYKILLSIFDESKRNLDYY